MQRSLFMEHRSMQSEVELSFNEASEYAERGRAGPLVTVRARRIRLKT